MEITPLQEVTSNNFKAHIQKLKEELTIVSSELDTKMRLKEESSKQLEELSATKQSLEKKIADYEKDYNQKLESVSISEKSLEKRELELKKDKESFEEQKGKEKAELETFKKNCEQSIANAKAELENTETKVTKSKAQLEKAENDNTLIEKEIKENLKKKNQAQKELDTLITQIEDSSIIHHKVVVNRVKELKELNIELEAAKELIKVPMANFEADKELFYKTLNNLEIRKRRLAKYIKRYFPDEILKI